MAKYGSEQILPYNNEEHKTTQVRRMFDSIAGTYDQLNHTLSLGIDKIWRRKGIAFLRPFSPASILDIATGTGDLAISMHRRLKADRIIGADISEGMMEVGRQKVAEAGLSDHITFEYQDCTALTYPDNSFDAVTAAFGVRNFENIEQGITEMYRVLKPGGHLMILELSSPVHFPMKQLYNIYSKVVPTAKRPMTASTPPSASSTAWTSSSTRKTSAARPMRSTTPWARPSWSTSRSPRCCARR